MADWQAPLRDLKPRHPFFVGIDSDGATFDTMELKHKECFIPNIIKYYGLQAASRYAREVAEFVNLYSRWRGINRFPALVLTMSLLKERPEATRRGIEWKSMAALERFVNSGKPLGNPALKEELERTKDPDLDLALKWSEAVNRDIAAMVQGVPPFPRVGDCLEALSRFADLVCVSATPVAALTAEWREHDLARFVRSIVGQEIATKSEALKAAVASGYDPRRILMVGDAPGDMEAAHKNGALFFPVVPGEEEASWERLFDEGLGRFQQGAYAGAYEDELASRFLSKLPSAPPWKN